MEIIQMCSQQGTKKKQTLTKIGNIFILLIISVPLTKMSSPYGLSMENKLIKSKSLQTFHPDNRLGRLSNAPVTSPKCQMIRTQQSNNYNDYRLQPQQASSHALTRVRSVDQLNKIRETANYHNIVELYKKENDNLKQQNKYLVKEIRKRQKNEQALTSYIDQLRREIKTLQRERTVSPSSTATREKAHSNTKLSKHSTDRYYEPELISSKATYQGDTWNTMYQIEELNEKFNSLMDQCSKETCRRTRNIIRAKLAETAEKMRNFKKEFNIGG